VNASNAIEAIRIGFLMSFVLTSLIT